MSASLRNKKVLITAGPTREYWDPVRYLTNASSGTMGMALASEAARLGASVTLVLGPTPIIPSISKKTRIVPVIFGWDMYQAVKKHLHGTDIFVGTGPFTGFAPSNEAFQKFGKEKLHQLLNPDNRDQLTSLIIYHVVPGKYLSKDLKSMDLKTINGKSLAITVQNGEIKVNNAKVIRKDLVGPNGVIHIIDTVLVP